MQEVKHKTLRAETDPAVTPSQDTFGRFIWNFQSNVNQKYFNLIPTPANDWLRISEQDVKGSFAFTVRVESLAEGDAIFETLLPHLVAPQQLERLIDPHSDFASYKVFDIYSAHIWNSGLNRPLSFARRLPSSQGSYELVIEFGLTPEAKTTAAHFYRSLLSHDRLFVGKPDWECDRSYDLSNNPGRRDWGYFNYYLAALSCSVAERRALEELGGPNYREIQRFMREGSNASRDNRVPEWAAKIESAISRGRTDRDIIVYRATRAPLDQHWDELNEGKMPEVVHSDRGFLVTTLDPKFVESWNQNYLKGQGVISSIAVPAGMPSAFLDAEGICTDRGYLELVFGPDTQIRFNSAYTDDHGQKRLHGTVELPRK